MKFKLGDIISNKLAPHRIYLIEEWNIDYVNLIRLYNHNESSLFIAYKKAITEEIFILVTDILSIPREKNEI